MRELRDAMDEPVLVPGEGFDGHLYFCTGLVQIGRYFHATMTHAGQVQPRGKVAVLTVGRQLVSDRVTLS
jgi:hypothetical protein